MYNFNKKQKIILAISAILIISAISIYMYFKENEEILYNEQDLDTLGKVETTNSESSNNEVTENKEESTQIIIHIAGAVNKEGVYYMNENSRISDAIEKAEGLKQEANTSDINLAYKLEDGMKIYIPTINEKQENANQELTTNQTNINLSNTNNKDNTQKYISSNNNTSSDSKTTQSSTINKVNINSATQTELETLPGIGPSTALKIINYRNENGKFTTIEQIKEVNGIGDAKFNNIKDLISIK